MKQNLNDMAVVLKCTVIAIVAAIHFVCLAGVYRLTVRYIIHKCGNDDIPTIKRVYIGVNVASGILSLLDFARALFESE